MPADAATHDVAIVGMGPVGLILANLLGTAGLKTIVLEKGEGINPLPRAIAYDDETLRVLADVGLLAKVEPCLITSLKARFLNSRGGTLMEVEPHDTAHGHSALGTFHQPSLEGAMLDGLARFPDVDVCFRHEVLELKQSDATVKLRVRSHVSNDTFDLVSRFVVGCDGGASLVRASIGAKLEGSSALERWLVVDAVVPGNTVDTISFYCDPERPTVEVPAVGDRVRWEFLQLAGETDEHLLDETTIRTLIARHADFSKLTIERTAVYTFRTLIANRWGAGRIFIAGDAAHMMPPFAGQGMNSGFKDASNLAWKLAAVLRSNAPTTLLTSYQQERRAPTMHIGKVSQALGHIIMARRKNVAFARDTLFRFANRSSAFRTYIRTGGLRSQSYLAKAAFFSACSGKGVRSMMPQPVVFGPDGPQLLDRLTGSGRWALIGFETDPRSLLGRADLALLERNDVAIVRLDASDGAPTVPQSATVADQRFIAWMRSLGCAGVLVRPDHFIAQTIDKGAALTALRAVDPIAAIPAKRNESTVPARSDPIDTVAKAIALAYVRFERPDLDAAEAYLKDFGLVPVQRDAARSYLRGSSPQPFIYALEKGRKAQVAGLGFDVATYEELEALAGAHRAVIRTNDEPGGGSILRLTAPNGLRVDVLHGRTPSAPLEQRPRILHNGPGETTRVNATQRPPLEPPLVVRLGHAVIETTDFDSMYGWFRKNLGMIPSDVLQLPSGAPAGAFMRFDLGATPSDHHSVFVTMGLEERLDHVAFEVLDLDAVHMGEQVLRERGYRHAWGVGRHKLGSQIFDYWRDPWNQKHEHYADGDVFDATMPTGYHAMDKAGLYQWGPDLPPDFIDARMTPRRALRLISRIIADRSMAKRFGALKNSMTAPGRPWQGAK